MANNPQVNLETYIIVPFEIVSRHKVEISHDWTVTLAKDSNWKSRSEHSLDSISALGLGAEYQKNIHYQAYNYFHPFVRDYWFNPSQVKRYSHTGVSYLHAVIYNGIENREVIFDVVCDLLHITPNIGMLVLHLKHNHLDLKTAQACLDQLRRLYPPYLSYGKDQKPFGGHFPVSVTLKDKHTAPLASFSVIDLEKIREKAAGFATDHPFDSPLNSKKRHAHLWAAHWAYLLEPFSTDIDAPPYRDFLVRQLGDDRAAVVSLISIHTDQNENITQLIDTGNLKRLCFADAPGNDPTPYSERFLTNERFFNEYCYTRFWYNHNPEESSDKPSLIMNSGYAFCWLGDANDGHFFANPRDGAPVTFRHIYVPMAIIAHFQKAFLLTLANRLTDLTPYENGKPIRINMKDFRQLKLDLIAFTQTYWFSEISPQEQGIELFEMWRKKLRMSIIHDDIRQQINDIVEYNNAEATSKINSQIKFLTYWAVILAIIGLAAGILGMNTFEIKEKPELDIDGLDYVNLFVRFITSWIPGLIAVFLFMAYVHKKRK